MCAVAACRVVPARDGVQHVRHRALRERRLALARRGRPRRPSGGRGSRTAAPAPRRWSSQSRSISSSSSRARFVALKYAWIPFGQSGSISVWITSYGIGPSRSATGSATLAERRARARSPSSTGPAETAIERRDLLAVPLLRDHRQRRRRRQVDERRDVVRTRPAAHSRNSAQQVARRRRPGRRSAPRRRSARPGAASNSNCVTMPKLPPPPRRPQKQVGVLGLARVDEPAVGGDDVGADEVVAGEAVLAHQPADAAAEREAGDAGGRDEAAGRREPVRLRLVVDVGPHGAAADGRAPARPGRRGRRSSARGRSRSRRRRSRSRRCCGRRRGRRSAGRCCARSRPPRSRRRRRCSGRRAPAGGRRARRSRSGTPRRSRRRRASRISPRTASRSSWTVASPSTGAMVCAHVRLPFVVDVRGVVSGAPLRGLSAVLSERRAAAPRRRATPSASSARRVALARVGEQRGAPARRRRGAARPRRGRRACARSSARAASRRAPRSASCERRLGVVEPAAREREVGRPPERAREAPAVAGAPEDVARLGEVPLGALVVAGGRLDQAEAGEREPDAAPVAQPAPQLERRARGSARAAASAPSASSR